MGNGFFLFRRFKNCSRVNFRVEDAGFCVRQKGILFMKRYSFSIFILLMVLCGCLGRLGRAGEKKEALGGTPAIVAINPPEDDFFSKRLDYHGIPIKSHQVVSDEALQEAWRRLDGLLKNQPVVLANLVAAGAQLHIIGRDQVTTDLPEFRQDKGVKLPEYNGLTRDERTRGMGGLESSCGEENLLKLEKDRYRGRDICVHEFCHGIFDCGLDDATRQKFVDQMKRSKSKGLWVDSYAASGRGEEFLSELTMWYVGTHGDLGMKGAKPQNGREGLKQYDPEAFALLDDFYTGRLKVTEVEAGTDH
jgi:hypothetical protein